MKTRWIRLFFLASLVGIGGFWLVRTLYLADPVDNRQLAQEALSRADVALREGQPKKAIQCLDELERYLVQSGKALDRAAKAKPDPKSERFAQLQQWKGEILWLKSASIRDRAFAKAALDGAPIKEMLDTTTGEKIRSWAAIPGDNERQQAITLLRAATDLSRENEKVLTDALRTELMLQPIQWQIIQPIAQALLKNHPDDTRALYLLARIEFEQAPHDAPGQPLAAERKNADRVAKALDFLQQIKQAKRWPVWRTLHLEAKALTWQLDDAARRRDASTAGKARAALEKLYWGDSGALARFRSGEGLEALAAWDIDGLLNLPLLAAEFRIRDGAKLASAESLVEINQDLANFCVRESQEKTPRVPPELALGQLLRVLTLSQTPLSRDFPAEWTTLLKTLSSQLTPPLTQGQIPPAAIARFADFLLWESRRQEQTSHRVDAVALRTDSDRWLREGLQGADRRKLTPAQQGPLHAAAVYHKLADSAPLTEITPHLRALSQLKEPAEALNFALCESLVSLRQGDLAKAVEKLDAVHRSLAPDQSFRAKLLLAHAYLGQGNFDRLLPLLRQLDSAFDNPDRLSVTDRLWLFDLAPSRDHLTYFLALSHLEIAKEKRLRYARENLAQKTAEDLVRPHELEADNLARRLRGDSPCVAWYLQAKAHYLTNVQLPERANLAIFELKRTPAHRLAALAADLDRNRSAADLGIVEKRLRESNDRLDRLILAVLLAETGRADQTGPLFPPPTVHLDLPGDQLLPDQLDALGDIGAALQRTDWWLTQQALCTAAAARYPQDARVVLSLGLALAGTNDPRARTTLERAERLARQRSSAIPADRRTALATTAAAALAKLPAK